MTARESSAVERAVAAYEAGGVTITAAAEACGVSRSALTRALRRRGVEPGAPGAPSKPPPPDPAPYYFADGSPLKRRRPAQPYRLARPRRP
jgi:transposase-like protein